MDTEQTAELIFVSVEKHLQLFVQSLLSLNEGFLERQQSHSVIDETVAELLFLVYELDHFNEEVFFLRGALLAFGVDFDDFVDSLVELFLLSDEFLSFLFLLGLGHAEGGPVLGK